MTTTEATQTFLSYVAEYISENHDHELMMRMFQDDAEDGNDELAQALATLGNQVNYYTNTATVKLDGLTETY